MDRAKSFMQHFRFTRYGEYQAKRRTILQPNGSFNVRYGTISNQSRRLYLFFHRIKNILSFLSPSFFVLAVYLLFLRYFFFSLSNCCNTAASETVYECPNVDACVGGATVASFCGDGFTGPRESVDTHGAASSNPSETTVFFKVFPRLGGLKQQQHVAKKRT